MKLDRNCLYQPAIFFKRNGDLLTVENIVDGTSTEFFLITSMQRNCMILMQLRPCFLCYPARSLEPTYNYITIEKSALCGYHLLENIYIRHCNHATACFTDCFYNRFAIQPGNDEAILWKSNIAGNQSGMLQVWVNEHIAAPFDIIVHQNNGRKVSALHSKCILLDQCTKITIRTNGKVKVNGVFKIDMKSTVKI